MNRIRWLGQNGGNLVDNTDSRSGNWFAIQILEEAQFTSLTDASLTVSGTLSAIVFPAGALVFGSFTAFELASGAVWAYKQ